jgi:UPF0716 family protein affecting phage T7 exclusion
MDWLALAVLGIIWGVLLLPTPTRREATNPLRRNVSSEEEEFRHPGRWILSPRRGARFLGRHHRARLRARERRRRVYLFLLELIGVTGLIGMFPPLRGMLAVTAVFGVLLVSYTGLVIWAGRIRLAPERAAPRPEVVVVLPDAEPDPFLEAQDRRVVRVGAR